MGFSGRPASKSSSCSASLAGAAGAGALLLLPRVWPDGDVLLAKVEAERGRRDEVSMEAAAERLAG